MKSIKEPIIIHGSIFTLESFSDKMITEEYLSWLKDEEVNRYLLKPEKTITMDQARYYCKELMQSNNNYFLAIIVNDINKHIGNVRLGPVDYEGRICRFSIMIGDKNYHGKGIASEIVALCIEYAFETLKMHKFCVDVIEDNKAAIRTYEKNNMVTEGILKDHVYMNNTYYDLRLMGIINSKE